MRVSATGAARGAEDPLASDRAPAVFLDRDGVLVRDVRHAADPARLELLPGAIEALRALRWWHYLLVVVTNQSGIARGRFTAADAQRVADRLGELLASGGGALDGYYYCPHYPQGSVPELSFACTCRKPAPGMLVQAANELGADLGRSWMVGDTLADVSAGQAAGVRPVLVDTGALSLAAAQLGDVAVTRNVAHAAAYVLSVDGHLPSAVELEDPAVLIGRAGHPDHRADGEASPFPAADRLAVAARDASWLSERTPCAPVVRSPSGGGRRMR
jgi:D-glycero-D-manno-heptose 1,7-bisphosphate phosphatase